MWKAGKWLFALALFEEIFGNRMLGEKSSGFLYFFEDIRIFTKVWQIGIDRNTRQVFSLFRVIVHMTNVQNYFRRAKNAS